MQIPDEHKSIPTRCYVRGHLRILTLEEAYVLFWEIALAWLLPKDWFRSGHTKGYMDKLTIESTEVFAYSLLTRGDLALTINDNSMLNKHDYPPSPNNFHARAHRFAKLFGANTPFVFCKVFDNAEERLRAYRMKPDQNWVIVIGVSPSSEFTDADVDWTIFLSPPDAKTKKAVVKVLADKGYI